MVNYNYLYDKELFEFELGINHLQEIQLSFTKHYDKCIDPQKEKAYWYKKYGYKDDAFFCKESIEEDDCEYVNEPVIFLGTLFPVWGHWITDNLRRFWFLYTKTYLEMYKNCKLVYVIDDENELSSNVMRLLEILDIDRNKMFPLKKKTKFYNIILPDNCF